MSVFIIVYCKQAVVKLLFIPMYINIYIISSILSVSSLKRTTAKTMYTGKGVIMFGIHLDLTLLGNC